MANRYKGLKHSFGVVLGALFASIASFVLSFFLFKLHFVFGLTAISFSIASFFDFLYNANFGGRVNFSANKKPSTDPEGYNFLTKGLIISGIIFLILLGISIWLFQTNNYQTNILIFHK